MGDTNDLLTEIQHLRTTNRVLVTQVQKFREHLWISHGHLQLYGDDGEMQCQECRADYLRDPIDDLAEKATAARRVMFSSLAVLPIPMILYCPMCGVQHIDRPQPEKRWNNPPHRSHECQGEGCGYIWRPADVPTVGVEFILTKGQRDSVTRSR